MISAKKTVHVRIILLAAFVLLTAAVAAVHADEPEAMTGSSEYSIPEQIRDNGLPIVYLDIDPEEYNNVINSYKHTYKAYTGSISIFIPDGYTGEYTESELTDMSDLALEFIRCRGNTTAASSKKPFKFKLKDKTDLLGMGKNKHWVLLANDYDDSLLHNRLGFWLGSAMDMPYTPEFAAVDFVVNGEYKGSYILGEELRVDSNRVAIDELTPEDNQEPNITGGYLIRMNPYFDELRDNVFRTDQGVAFRLDTPAFDPDSEGTAEQKAYITGYLQDVENAVCSTAAKDSQESSCSDLMDLKSAAKYWLVQEFIKNGDAFTSDSTYLYKERSGKLYWGPLWDMDLIFSTISNDESFAEGFNYTVAMPWLDQLRYTDPEYQQMIRNCWPQMDKAVTEIIKEDGILDQYAAQIEKSWEDNKSLFPEGDRRENLVFEDEVEEIRTYLTQRQKWVAENINTEKLTKVYGTITFTVNDNVVKTQEVRIGDSESEIVLPTAEESYTEGYVITGWKKENGEELNSRNIVRGDIHMVAELIPEAEAILADGLFPASSEVWAEIDDKSYDINYTTVPYDAQDSTVKWTSSDVRVASVSGDTLMLNSTGEARITGTLRSGVKNSFVLHVYSVQETPVVDPTQIVLENSALTLDPGEYGQIGALETPSPSYYYLNYTSGNRDVAKVNTYGVVQALSPGTCTITVTDHTNGLTATCTVTVTDNSEAVNAARQELTDIITSANRDLAGGEYSAESVSKLRAAIEETNDLLDRTGITMREIRIAKVRLQRAWRLLVPVEQTEDENLQAYRNAVNALCETLIKAYREVCPSASDYTASSYAAFEKTCADAENALADEESTAEDLQNKKSNILKVWKDLKLKSGNTLTAKGRTVKIKSRKLKKKSRKISVKRACSVGNARGITTYKLVSVKKSKFKKYFKINAKTGKITVKKGLKKGTYKLKIRITASGDGNYKAGSRTVTVKIRIK